MDDQQQIERRKHNWRRVIFVCAIIVSALIVFPLFVAIAYIQNWTWTGLPNQPDLTGQPNGAPKSFWDWLDLLIVPLVLAGGGLLFSKAERDNERQIAEKRAARESERDIVNRLELQDRDDKRHALERELTENNAREGVLSTYFDRLSSLLIEHHIARSTANDEALIVARARTLSVLHRLDGRRKGDVIRFLYDAGFLSGNEPILDLRHANMSDAKLSGATIPNINMETVDLMEANLSGTDLTSCFLHKAHLSGADFNRAHLNKADLSNTYASPIVRVKFYWTETRSPGINFDECDLTNALLVEASFSNASFRDAILSRVDMRGCTLEGADFERATMAGANMSRAKLGHANLQNSNLEECNLSEANLEGADLSRASLVNADLTGARLKGAHLLGANLQGANLTRTDLLDAWIDIGQVRSASTFTGARLPNPTFEFMIANLTDGTA